MFVIVRRRPSARAPAAAAVTGSTSFIINGLIATFVYNPPMVAVIRPIGCRLFHRFLLSKTEVSATLDVVDICFDMN